MNGPERVAAFFDLDGTVVEPPSLEWRFIGFLLARDELGTGNVARWFGHFAKKIFSNPRGATISNKRYLAGLRESLRAEWAGSLEDGAPQLQAAAIRRMAWHWGQGHRIFLVSGTLEFLAQAVARRLVGPVEVRATRLEASGGRWTGRLIGEHMSGETKARAVRSLAGRLGLSLWDSYAYGNSTSDLPMLDSVGHRVAVNPAAPLARIARSEGWPVSDWRAADGRAASRLRPCARRATR